MSSDDSDVSIVEDDEPVNTNHTENADATELNSNNDAPEAEVKIKRVRNPQPKLNAERLQGPRGIHILQELFKDVKFRGRGHEEKDLNLLMKTYEYWCHRLFPKLPFDDCLEKIEKLGYKKPVQVHIKKIRMNMLWEDRVVNDVVEMNDDVLNEPESSTNNFSEVSQIASRPSELTEEQLERIRINRERAQQLRLQALNRKKQNVVDALSSSNGMNWEGAMDPTITQDSCTMLNDTDQNEIIEINSDVTMENEIVDLVGIDVGFSDDLLISENA